MANNQSKEIAMNDKKHFLGYLIVLTAVAVSLISCTGPASKMASKEDGVTKREIGRCETRSCFLGLLSYGGQILKSEQTPSGYLEEIYQVKREKGSTLRSFTHGILSVATLGVWNVVGYPIEGFVSSSDFIVFRVIYNPAEQPTKVEIHGG